MGKATDLSNNFFRTLIYGPAKTRKTWWAGAAAESGYNVLLLDGDQGSHVLINLTQKAKERITIINCADSISAPSFSNFLTKFLKAEDVYWNDTRNKIVLPGNAPEDNVYYKLNSRLLTKNDVVILDSHTALTASVISMFALLKGIDLGDADRQEWEGYRYCGQRLDWYRQRLVKLPCHVIVIGHADVYEKYAPGPDGKPVLVSSRIQPISSSKPHAMKIAVDFSDVLYFEFDYSSKNQVYIDTKGVAGRDGGSRVIQQRSKWEELQFSVFAQKLGIKPPGIDGPRETPGYTTVDYEDLPAQLRGKGAGKRALIADKVQTGSLTALSQLKK